MLHAVGGPDVKEVTSAPGFGPDAVGKHGVMSSVTLDPSTPSAIEQLTLEQPAAEHPVPATAAAAAPSTPEERRVAAALRRATEDAANAARNRRLDRIAFGALVAGLVISLGTFGVIAYDNSVSQSGGAPASVSTTP